MAIALGCALCSQHFEYGSNYGHVTFGIQLVDTDSGPSTIYGVEVEKLTNMDADFFTVQNWIVRNFGTLVINNL